MSKSEYLDSFEYMQGIAYRDAIKTDYYERLLEKQYEKENKYVWEYSKENSLKNDPTYQAWIIERGAPPDCAALWQEACADFFFLQECDGKCSICKKLIQFKGGLK